MRVVALSVDVAALVVAALVAVLPANAVADPVVAAGVVVDGATGAAVPGALVVADAASVETGPDGTFSLPAVAAGSHLIVIADGYAPAELDLGVGPLRVALAPAAAAEVIEITGKAPDLASPTAYTLGREQIRALPGSGNDVLRALQSLPGVGRVSYGIGGMVLRGISPTDSTVVVDGIDVPLAFHFGGLSSFFPSTLLDTIVLTPGGAEVAFGRRVGGVVELRSRAPRADRYRVGGELGVLDASTYGEGPLAGGAISLGLRRSYADLFLDRLLPPDRPVLPRYYDGQLRWDRSLAGGTLTLLGFFSDDHVVGWGGSDFAQAFARVAARYRRRVGPATVTVTPWGGTGATDFAYLEPGTAGAPDRPGSVHLERRVVGLRADGRRDTSWGHLALGVDVQGNAVAMSVEGDQILSTDGRKAADGRYLDAGAWLDARWRIAEGALTLRPGLRVDRLGIPARTVVEPRLVVTHELSSWLTLRETFGAYHQPSGPVGALDGTYLSSRGSGDLVSGLHASVGGRVALPGAAVAVLTAYYVGLRGPPDPRSDDPAPTGADGDTFPIRVPVDLGIVFANLIGEEFGGLRDDRRRGAGLELSLQRRTERWTMWLSYALAANQFRHNGPSRVGWLTEDLDQTHNLNLVASVRLGGWQLGTRLRYATGLPYSPRVTASDEGPFGETVTYGRPNGARLRDFASLDLRVDRAWRRRWGTVATFLDVQNVTLRHNVEGVTYETGSIVPDFTPGLPILPMLGVSYQPAD